MKKTIAIGVLALCLLLNFTAAEAGDLTTEERTKIEAAVDTAFTEMVLYAETLDYDKLSSGVGDSQLAGFIVANRYYPDYESMMAVLKPAAQGVSEQHISFSNKKITVLTETVVLLTASGISNATLNDGRSFQTKFYWSFVYQNFEGEWKVVQSHQSVSN